MDNFETVKRLIKDFEDSLLNIEELQSEIKKIINKKVDEYALINYWRSETLDNFVAKLLADTTFDSSKSLLDSDSILLIQEILDNVHDDIVIDKNSRILEFNYSKPSGVVSDWIFEEDITDSAIILKKLKENNSLLL